jgi:hypothetical protein
MKGISFNKILIGFIGEKYFITLYFPPIQMAIVRSFRT